jgi:polysaccharide biosynthesis transport protein
MAKIVTNRDRLDRLVDYFRKATRYWWLVGGLVVLGGVLATWFAQSRPRKYQSWAVVFYQERIQSTVLRGGAEQSLRNIGDRYRELLLSQTLLLQIIEDPKLNPYPELLAKQGPDAAVEAIRLNISFQSRGNSAFRISYIDEDPVRAQAISDKLTELLNSKDDELRSAQVQRTATFAEEQKLAAIETLRARQKALAEFLQKHPEFVQDNASQSSEFSAIRASQNKPPQVTSSNPRIASLERQRNRILARLNAKPGAVEPVVEAPSPERTAALAALAEVERDLAAAKRDFEAESGRYTEIHPNWMKARDRVNALIAKRSQAQAAVPASAAAPVPPSSPEDRAALQRELKALEEQIASAQSIERGRPVSAQEAASASESWVVELETQYADLRRGVGEQQGQLASLTDSAFRAKAQADQLLAEQGGRLTVVDPAFRPTKPHGAGKSVFILAGLVVFGAIGGAIALGLALIDDRLYRRDDLDELGLTVLAVIPEAKSVKKKPHKPRRRAGEPSPSKDLST